jgi:hypothetical protein
LSARAPALIGAAVYIASAYAVVRALARETAVEWPLFVCLVYNPFVMDYLVAARGYGLALGFWMAAIALIAWGRGGVIGTCMLASICAALSFAANFSFAFADGFVMVLGFLWACGHEQRNYEKILASCLLPGLAVAAVLTGSLLWNWPGGQFVHGANSLGEMAASILACSLYEINRYLVNPPLAWALEESGVWIFALLAVAAAALALSARWKNLQWAMAFTGVGIATLGAHWVLHRYFGVLLPKERTAIFFAPLLFLIAGAVMTAPAPRQMRAPAIVLLYVAAAYFVCCLRLTYFREWKFDADVKRVYSVLSYYNHTFGVRDIFPNWRYVAALNYYRARSNSDTIPKLEYTLPPYSKDHDIYVMYYPVDEEFIRKNCLRIVYHGPLSDVVVAIRPEVESPRPGNTIAPFPVTVRNWDGSGSTP